MPGKGEGRGREEKGENGRKGEGRKVRAPPPSIPAYATGKLSPSLGQNRFVPLGDRGTLLV